MDKKQEDHSIQFKPITKGLGFHPFSDNAPYAPISKTQIRPSTPRKKKKTVRVNPGVPHFKPPKKKPEQAQVSVTPERSIDSNLNHGYFYLFKRFFAYGFDTLFNFSLCSLALGLALFQLNIHPKILLNFDTIPFVILFLCFFSWALVTAQEIAFETSLGKKLFGLSLEGGVAAIFLRSFFFLISLGFFGFGLIIALFDKKRRCLHDFMTEVFPREVAEL